MVNRDTYTTVANGDGLNQGFFNTMANVRSSTTPAVTWNYADSRPKTLTTVNIAAGLAANYVLILLDLTMTSTMHTVPDTTPSCELFIGQAGSETSRTVYSCSSSIGTSSGSVTQRSAQIFAFVPTAGEKANGFNIIAKGDVSGSGSSGSLNSITVLTF